MSVIGPRPQLVRDMVSLSLLTATIIENGALRRYFTLFYPVIALCCLVTVQLRNEKKMTEFINAMRKRLRRQALSIL